MTFFTLICYKKCIVCLKRLKINKKRPGLARMMSSLYLRALTQYPNKYQRQLVVSVLTSTGQNQHYGNILLCKTSVISIMVSHFDNKHRCLIEKNVPIALILPSRWQEGAESLGIERTSCLCKYAYLMQKISIHVVTAALYLCPVIKLYKSTLSAILFSMPWKSRSLLSRKDLPVPMDASQPHPALSVLF